MELTKPTDLNLEVPLNGKLADGEDGDETVSEPATPTTNEERSLEENSQLNKKKKRKRSKKGKQQH